MGGLHLYRGVLINSLASLPPPKWKQTKKGPMEANKLDPLLIKGEEYESTNLVEEGGIVSKS